MYILGISFGHAAAVVLLENGKILSAIEEEKLSRVKGCATFPKLSLEYLYKKFSISAKDIDIVAIGCENLSEFSYSYRTLNRFFGNTNLLHRSLGLFHDGRKRYFPSIDISREIVKLFYKFMADLGFSSDKIRLVNHHLAHAASAYYSCPWAEAAIITNDGKGDGLCGTFSVGKKGKIECYNRIEDLHSIGQFYQSVTKFLGFKINREEGKLTGLAAYGDSSKTFSLMNRVYKFENGYLKNKFHQIQALKKDPLRYFQKSVKKKDFITENYIRSLHGSLRNFAIAYQMYLNFLQDEMSRFEPKDIAAGIQKLAEETVVAYVKTHLALYFSPNLCLAGGVFANVKINQRILEIPGVKNVYIHPAMYDSGTAFGAALYVWMALTDKTEWPCLRSIYLGPEYTEAEIEESIKRYNLHYERIENHEDLLGKLIFEGKIIGRFNGALEWGPRALGNRSILARPTDKTINNTLNKRLKRTEFMPFAPSILDVDAEHFLVGYSREHIAARYMTLTYNVKPSKAKCIPAVVHIDGTARPQVVFEKDNPSFYGIIKAYKKYSELGVVVNTSFNMHEEPIVDSPDHAIKSFLAGAVDILSIGPFIVGVSPS